MTYKIVPRDFEFEIEASSPEEAMNKFVLQMDMNMNNYMEAVGKPKTHLEKFAYKEARFRLNEDYECYDEDRIKDVGYALAYYLLNDESALNYDGIDDVIAEAMED